MLKVTKILAMETTGSGAPSIYPKEENTTPFLAIQCTIFEDRHSELKQTETDLFFIRPTLYNNICHFEYLPRYIND